MAQSFTIEYNGLTLGDGTEFNISNFNPGELPLRVAEQLASGRDGGFIFNQNYGMRTPITFDIDIVSRNEADFFANIDLVKSAFTRTNTAIELTINYWSSGRVRKINVFPTILPNPVHESSRPDSASFSIELKAPYPFYTSDTGVVTTQLELVESEGFDYPMDYPFDYEAGASTNSYSFNNDGQVAAILKVVFNGSAINPTLFNTTTGEYIQIETTLLSTDSITMQYTTNGRQVVSNTGVNYEQYFNGQTAFFFIPLGTNDFLFTASTYDVSASCDLTFTKYYLI